MFLVAGHVPFVFGFSACSLALAYVSLTLILWINTQQLGFPYVRNFIICQNIWSIILHLLGWVANRPKSYEGQQSWHVKGSAPRTWERGIMFYWRHLLYSFLDMNPVLLKRHKTVTVLIFLLMYWWIGDDTANVFGFLYLCISILPNWWVWYWWPSMVTSFYSRQYSVNLPSLSLSRAKKFLAGLTLMTFSEDLQKFVDIETICELLKLVLGSRFPAQVESMTEYLKVCF